METTQDIWEVLDNAPARLDPIAELFRWATNYDYQTGTPWQKFLDLIGYSAENFGEHICPGKFELDHISVDYFAPALECWADRPQDACDFIDKILAAD